MKKVLYYTGNNPRNKSGMSSKVWSIQRDGQTVTTLWGSVNLTNLRLVRRGNLSSKERLFDSVEEARTFMQQRIARKVQKGYVPKPRRA